MSNQTNGLELGTRWDQIMPHSSEKILIVDDEPYIRRILSRWLGEEGYECVGAPDAETASEILESDSFGLLISDIKMPDKSGIDLLIKTKQEHSDLAVLMVTAVDDRNLALETLHLGAYGYLVKPFDKNEIIINVANALERRRLHLIEKQYQEFLKNEVQAKTAEIRHREEELVQRLVLAVESRDKDTGDHACRVGHFSASLARALGWEHEQVENIRLAGAMHDIGKLGIPDGILCKPEQLTAEEFEVIKQHCELGARVLRDSDCPLLEMALEIVLSHHEKWDGSGYPQGLAGEEIPESARIVAIADVYDAVTHARVYRPAFPEEEALAIMKKGRAKHFDPRVLDCFFELIPGIQGLRESTAIDRPEVFPPFRIPFAEEPTLSLKTISTCRALVAGQRDTRVA